jgi:hypothetical protein
MSTRGKQEDDEFFVQTSKPKSKTPKSGNKGPTYTPTSKPPVNTSSKNHLK